MKIPAIVVADRPFSEPQGCVHYFCCTGCRSQSPHHDPYSEDIELAPAFVASDIECETCGRAVSRNADL